MRSIELFAGIGGIALAAEWAGIETVAFCEREPYCQKLLNQNFPDVPVFDDVCTLNRQLLEDEGVIEPNGTIDIISGGFPCQPYSIAGKKRGTEDDRDLWPEMFRIIKELRPTWVVGENVANFANMELERTLLDLESEGYKVETLLVPAVAVDAPHERMRTFVVAHSERLGWEKRTSNERKSRIRKPSDLFGNCGETVVDTTSERCNQMEQHDGGGKKREETVREDWKCSVKPRGDESRWAAEPNVGRVAHGVPNRVDRIKGLGNAVVPQQIYPIFKAIVDISNRA
ncbi:DNA cytosine methyltransferase [Bacillus sp. 179-C3.3 HS]|uniref:DNA cytosine methyltransferase n=1 Tax=Bacillus sp. 179-C3.3 HS TaxID=3232162 RepID=UPI0039A1397F